MPTSNEIISWFARHARALRLDADVPLPAALHDAQVVGLASAVRSARELVAVTHALMRALVEQAGFRAVTIEGTDLTGAALDHYVHTGEGDPEALLAASQSFLRIREAVPVVRWLRSWNECHPGDEVSVVHGPGRERPPRDLPEIEAALAKANLDWLADTGQRIVHWGGTAHLLVVDPPPGQGHPNAGAIMRAELGAGYAVAALTTGSGSAPFRLPLPPQDFLESAFVGTEHVVSCVDLAQTADAPPRVREWLSAPVRTRMIGPVYDPDRDHEFRLDGGPVREAIDLLVHVPRVTPVTPLDGRS
ncbi:erythromycin esterase family protein [Prauserella cavernicola]|uniref:Erythromycin esterase family protein n=1 Tax=Prauserella cavernicola TaxID=2800127 RepID=A0A934QU05_9PSEU|nr:erythromycin esterase family protein [Prauserella cavernicola]MBK1785599.1 erythromycin esterase family protein [Prauserella cavernicola]